MKALILGATGMLGHQVYLKFKKSGNFSAVRAAVLEKRESLKDCKFFSQKDIYGGVDFFKDGFDIVKEIIFKDKPDVIVNCIVLKPGNMPREKFLLLNSFLPHYLARLANLYGGKLVQISTDGVFSGKRGLYSENDIADAKDDYGASKFFGETDYKNNLTIRTSIFGHDLFGKKGLLEWFMRDKNPAGFKNVYFSGVTTNFLAESILKILEKKASGLVNIASKEKISKLDLLRLINKEYGLKKEIIPARAKIKTDRSLNVKKMISLGVAPRGHLEMIKEMKKEYLKNKNCYGN
jgi:dTDP-4-dehydrorhamnose reductase